MIDEIVYGEIHRFIIGKQGKGDGLQAPPDITLSTGEVYRIGDSIVNKLNQKLAEKYLSR